jgi:hypothetical protein
MLSIGKMLGALHPPQKQNIARVYAITIAQMRSELANTNNGLVEILNAQISNPMLIYERPVNGSNIELNSLVAHKTKKGTSPFFHLLPEMTWKHKGFGIQEENVSNLTQGSSFTML